ncbi:hypothetical protein HDV00_010633 [Rhizophlyctis rosea]|nr:hypothetical protein HDV00_010633 [Rhizophlyctis rosea]
MSIANTNPVPVLLTSLLLLLFLLPSTHTTPIIQPPQPPHPLPKPTTQPTFLPNPQPPTLTFHPLWNHTIHDILLFPALENKTVEQQTDNDIIDLGVVPGRGAGEGRVFVVGDVLVVAGNGTMEFSAGRVGDLRGVRGGAGGRVRSAGMELNHTGWGYTTVRAWNGSGAVVGDDVMFLGVVDEGIGRVGEESGGAAPVVVGGGKVVGVDVGKGVSDVFGNVTVEDWYAPFNGTNIITFRTNASTGEKIALTKKIYLQPTRSITLLSPSNATLWTFTPSLTPLSTHNPTPFRIPTPSFTSTLGTFLTLSSTTLYILTEDDARTFALFIVSASTGKLIAADKVEFLGAGTTGEGEIFPRVASVDAITLRSEDEKNGNNNGGKNGKGNGIGNGPANETLYITYTLQTVSGPPPSPITTRPITLSIPISLTTSSSSSSSPPQKIHPAKPLALPPPLLPPTPQTHSASATLLTSQTITTSGRYLVQAVRRVGGSSVVVVSDLVERGTWGIFEELYGVRDVWVGAAGGDGVWVLGREEGDAAGFLVGVWGVGGGGGK